LKDLSLSSHIPELIESGVASLKIEGRMKSPEYVFGVTSIYRRLLDERRNATKEEEKILASLFSRGGFTDGYFVGNIEKNMLGIRSDADKEMTRALEKRVFNERKLKISAECTIKEGDPSTLSLICKDKKITVEGAIPERAKSSPLSDDGVKAQLLKMGNTFFSLEKSNIALSLGEGLNMPISSLNALRREAAEALASELSKKEEGFIPKAKAREAERKHTTSLKTALCFKRELLETIEKSSPFDIIYLPVTEFDENGRNSNGVYIPPVITENEIEKVIPLLERAKALGAKYALLGNISHFAIAERVGLIPTGDHRLNILNKETKKVYENMGALRCILSPELTLPQIRDIKADPIVYGRIPLMLLERCYMKENFGCKKCNDCSLSDRRGVKFPLIREFEHRNLLLNSSVTYMGDKKDLLLSYGIKGGHFIFTTETKEECRRVLRAYEKGEPYPLSHTIKRIKK
jgi:putative protease